MFKKGKTDANETEVHRRVQEPGGAGSTERGKDGCRGVPRVRTDGADDQRVESAVSGRSAAGV